MTSEVTHSAPARLLVFASVQLALLGPLEVSSGRAGPC